MGSSGSMYCARQGLTRYEDTLSKPSTTSARAPFRPGTINRWMMQPTGDIQASMPYMTRVVPCLSNGATGHHAVMTTGFGMRAN